VPKLSVMRLKLKHLESARQTLDVIWELPERDRLRILSFWWKWWNNRNKIREGETPIAGVELLRRVASQTEEYLELLGKNKRKESDREKWRPPIEGHLKLNSDAAYNPGDSYATWGVVVRDHQGDLVAARAGRMLAPASTTTVGPNRQWPCWYETGLGQQQRRMSCINTRQKAAVDLAWNGTASAFSAFCLPLSPVFLFLPL
jgi:hypothetical protein